MNSRFVMLSLAAALSLSLAACGGGGDDSSGGTTTDPQPAPGGTTTDPQPAPGGTTTDPQPVPAGEYWTMNSYRYQKSSYGAYTTNRLGQYYSSVAVLSTATLSGGDQANGEYSGGNLNISLKTDQNGAPTPGRYTAVSLSDYVSSSPAQRYIHVQSGVGVNVTTGAETYESTSTSGTVDVTVGANGRPVFAVTGLTLTRNPVMSVAGGITGAPQTMTLVAPKVSVE